MAVKGDEIEVAAIGDRASPRKTSILRLRGKNMGVTGKKSKPPGKDNDKPKKSAPKRIEDDDDYEDGDIATPKKDRYGEDDEPL